jgi:hypothetical protein
MGKGFQPIGAPGVEFGAVELGSAAVRHFAFLNQQSTALAVPPVSVQGGDFALSAAPASGTLLQPGQSAGFDMRFAPAAAGARAGTLVAGERSYAVSGTGLEPPLPRPSLSVSLPQTQSAQQGSIAVKLDAASKIAGSGTVTIDFHPSAGLSPGAADQAVQFAPGGRTAAFTVAPGDTQGRFGTQSALGFQTGTTSGDLVFTVELGGITARQTVNIAPAPVGVAAAQGSRAPGGIEIDVTGFDNTRTAGQLTYTFFDAAGNAIPPGAMRADAAAGFAAHFASSGLGGVFLLKAVFPVTGDAARVAAFEVQLTNSAGTSKTARTSF